MNESKRTNKVLFPVQAHYFRSAMVARTILEVSLHTGIKKTRLHRLIKGYSELTVREAQALANYTNVAFSSREFAEKHYASAPLVERQPFPGGEN